MPTSPSDTQDPWLVLAQLCAQAFDVRQPTQEQLGMVRTTIVRTVQSALGPQALEAKKLVALERIASQLEVQSAIEIVRLQKDGATEEELAALLSRLDKRGGQG